MSALKLPTLFKGVMWDEGWEFDAPCVVYSPYKRYGYGGNSYSIDRIVEAICIDISIKPPTAAEARERKRWNEHTLKEFKWRGWSPRGFAKRKRAWHVEISVRWLGKEELTFEFTGRDEQYGPFAS